MSQGATPVAAAWQKERIVRVLGATAAAAHDKTSLLLACNNSELSSSADGEGGKQRGRRMTAQDVNRLLRQLVKEGVVQRKKKGKKTVWLLASSSGAPLIPVGEREKSSATEEKDTSGEEEEEDEVNAVSSSEQPAAPFLSKKWQKTLNKLPRGMTEVLPGFLYVGSGADAEDDAALLQQGITHILNVAGDWPARRPRPHSSSSSANGTQNNDEDEREERQEGKGYDGVLRGGYKQLMMMDDVKENLLRFLPDAFAFIDEAARQNEGEEGESEQRRLQPKRNKVLVHCALGKSRSVAVVLAYVVHYYFGEMKSAREEEERMSLKDAYVALKRKRSFIRPNSSFLRQLMRFEEDILNSGNEEERIKPSLTWYDIDTETDMLSWFRANNRHKREINKGMAEGTTHLWWTSGDKPQFAIDASLKDELFSEYTKAVVRGEQLWVVEQRSSPLYRLYIDLDIKCSHPSLNIEDASSSSSFQPFPLSDVIAHFIPGITSIVSQLFLSSSLSSSASSPCSSSSSPLSQAQKEQETEEEEEEDLNDPSVFSLSGTSGPFTHSHRPQVNWKYGFHFVWPNLLVNEDQHKRCIRQLIQHFSPPPPASSSSSAQNEDKEEQQNETVSNNARLPEFITSQNALEELFDMTMFTTTQSIRMLYSSKYVLCRVCGKQSNLLQRSKNKKKTKNKHQQRHQQKQMLLKEKRQKCKACDGTGLKDERKYQFMGLHSSRRLGRRCRKLSEWVMRDVSMGQEKNEAGGQQQKGGEEAEERRRRLQQLECVRWRVELCSIRHW
ncbi:tyrosine protein phosphatase yvh1 [Balamuthia mandrillaris]